MSIAERQTGKKSRLLHELAERILFFDGGTGSLLQAAGLKPGELPETWKYPPSRGDRKAAQRLP